jgi:hypothetical protein
MANTACGSTVAMSPTTHHFKTRLPANIIPTTAHSRLLYTDNHIPVSQFETSEKNALAWTSLF